MLNLKNKAEREAFIEDYRRWDIWHSIPEFDFRIYGYIFQNKAMITVTEYKEYHAWKKEYVTNHRYCLILPENDDYVDSSSVCGEDYHKTYTPKGCGMGTVVDYMTKNKSGI